MVQFGQYLAAHRVPGWENYYINYKILKKTIKRYEGSALHGTEEEREEAIKIFSHLLDSQVEGTVLFFLEQQGELAAKLQRLREHLNEVEKEEGKILWLPDVTEKYRSVARDLLQLLQFVELNATGIRKILKKFDRRVGLHLAQKYLETRTQHPHSHLQQVFRQVGLGALVATITRNLGELRQRQLAERTLERRYSTFNLFAREQASTDLLEDEPVLKEIAMAQSKLTKAVTFNSFVANTLLLPPPRELHPGVTAEEEEGKKEQDFHWWSLQLNQVNTFLYMVNYYIVVPTSDDYAALLNAPPSLCGVIIGSMPLCALISAYVYSKWSNTSYSHPLYASTFVLIVGNVWYAAAYDSNAVWMLLAGRALAGLGGARAINRRYISDHVPLKMRTAASAAFVSASALGMAAGPALAGLMGGLNFKLFGFTVNAVTSPGWLMTILWLFYLLGLALLFKEPPKQSVSLSPSPSAIVASALVGGGPKREKQKKNGSLGLSSNGGDSVSDLRGLGIDPESSRDLEQPLLASSAYSETSSERDDDDDDGFGPVETLADLRRELTVPVQILLFIYFFIKFAQEVLVSQSSLVTKFYFQWNTDNIGVFLAVLGATVLPISALVGNYISNIYEDRLVLFWTQVITGAGVLGILNLAPVLSYSHTQYIAAAITIFVAANVTEGVNMALLSKVMSPALASGTFNCGFLSTEAGTLARVVGDGIITATGYFGTQYVLNLTMLPVLAVGILSVWLTRWRYLSLFG